MHPTRLLRASHGPEHNITGFDIGAFRKASNSQRYDPWERHEAWRYQGRFTRWNRFKAGFPGLGIATVAFAAYCGYEHFFLNNDEHGHGHAEEHH
ncbi:NADH-ubiquinone oxidoreductase b12 [Niveomyces insectorum RCEF 264]|uniref:NADH-ubiquinone oxidoreductase b12 n=1 Tax=Niveomyces insectorum RCEF 264 TaxID=1081102 RepID=A0A162K6R4_9HYPO|nr:NADH-ubiquinone oxidoreductase b12 [Niveomyces insectorum RCEF 264]